MIFMKKITTRLLSLVLLGAFIPSFALAQEWDLNNGNIIVNAVPGTEQTVSQAGSTPTVDNNPVITSNGNSTSNTVTITAAENATANVTLENVSIDTGKTGGAAITASGEGNVNIELDGTNRVQSGNTHAGVEKKDNGTLTITDENKDGSLTANGGGVGGAGIGGGYGGSGSNITIEGGKVTATGGFAGAGIGGGAGGSGSNIAVSGGEVTAQGGFDGAGIGGGAGGSGSNITISDGKVTATGGGAGAGIGGGYIGSGKGITIEGGEVTAQGDAGGAGIGGGISGTGSDVTISGDAQVKVQGGRANENWHKGAAIGNGGTSTTDGNEVSPNTSDLTVEGSIQIYEPGRNINTDTPDRTIEGQKGDHSWNAGEVTAETVPESKAAAYWVSDSQGQSIPYQAQQKDGVLTVTVQADTASLRGTTGSLRQLEAQGIAEIRFVTKGAQSAFTLADLLASGTGSFALTHEAETVRFTLAEKDISGILK